MRALAALVFAALRGDAFYLPGVAPRTFRYGDKVRAPARDNYTATPFAVRPRPFPFRSSSR